jgi:hypothetical protein
MPAYLFLNDAGTGCAIIFKHDRDWQKAPDDLGVGCCVPGHVTGREAAASRQCKWQHDLICQVFTYRGARGDILPNL